MTEPSIVIHSATVRDLHRLTRKRERETGGILVGFRSAETPTVWVSDIIETPDEHATHATWTLRSAGANRLLQQRLAAEPNPMVGYVGTWHTHTAAVPEPSAIDLATFGAECDQNCSYVAMVIASVGRVLTGMVGSDALTPTAARIEREL